MAKVGAQKAADITGVSKSTIQRAMKSGKLSFERDPNGYRVIDTSELERVYGLKDDIQVDGEVAQKAAPATPVETELAKASTMIEMERMKMRIYMLEQQLDAAHSQIEDLKDQRDQWQKQASQVLITSEFSQRQAEELKEQIRQRDERVRAAKARREQQRQALGAERPAQKVVSSSKASKVSKGSQQSGVSQKDRSDDNSSSSGGGSSSGGASSMASAPASERITQPKGRMTKEELERKIQQMTAAQSGAANDGNFVDNSRSYVDLTRETEAGHAGRKDGGLMAGLLKKLRGAA